MRTTAWRILPGLLLLAAAIGLGGCAAGLAALTYDKWDDWFSNDDATSYRVYIDGYDIGSTAEANGNLVIRGIQEGDYLVTVALPTAMRRGVHLVAHIKSGVSLSLSNTNPFEGGAITGVLRRDSSSGAVLPNVRVVAIKGGAALLAGGTAPITIPPTIDSDIDYMMGFTDSTGSYRLGPAQYGDWLVTAAVAGYQSDVKYVRVSSGTDGAAPLVLLTDAAANPGLVRGTVNNKSGSAIQTALMIGRLGAGFAPSITDAGRNQVQTASTLTLPTGAWFSWLTLCNTGSTGGQYMLDIPAGTHSIEAFKPGYTVVPQEFTVTDGGVSTQDFSLSSS